MKRAPSFEQLVFFFTAWKLDHPEFAPHPSSDELRAKPRIYYPGLLVIWMKEKGRSEAALGEVLETTPFVLR